jgi:hypothetical protein
MRTIQSARSFAGNTEVLASGKTLVAVDAAINAIKMSAGALAVIKRARTRPDACRCKIRPRTNAAESGKCCLTGLVIE